MRGKLKRPFVLGKAKKVDAFIAASFRCLLA